MHTLLYFLNLNTSNSQEVLTWWSWGNSDASSSLTPRCIQQRTLDRLPICLCSILIGVCTNCFQHCVFKWVVNGVFIFKLRFNNLFVLSAIKWNFSLMNMSIHTGYTYRLLTRIISMVVLLGKEFFPKEINIFPLSNGTHSKRVHFNPELNSHDPYEHHMYVGHCNKAPQRVKKTKINSFYIILKSFTGNVTKR